MCSNINIADTNRITNSIFICTRLTWYDNNNGNNEFHSYMDPCNYTTRLCRVLTHSKVWTLLNKSVFVLFLWYLFSSRRFPSGYGLFMFMQGMVLFVFTAIVNKIGNVFDDDIIVFHCLTLVMSFCVIPWAAEMIWLKVKKN